MSYTKTTWKTGDVITAEKLNKVEDQVAANEEAISSAGGDDSVFIVNIDAEGSGGTITATADKTRQEMSAAVEAGKPIIIRLTRNYPAQQSSTIFEMAPRIWAAPQQAGGYEFAATKILQVDGTSKKIYTAELLINEDNNNTDIITVSFPTYTFT